MKYDIIYADPAWQYGDKLQHWGGGAESHYPTMSVNDICNLKVKDIASDNSVLFLWATYPTLPDAFKVIEGWGFKYKTIGFQWVKTYKNGKPFFGLGHWTRGNTEPCLIATKGKIKRVDKAISQLVFSQIRRHSEKPPEVRDLIVKLMGDRPRVELFARAKTQGWDSWGNEIQSDIIL